MEFDKEFRIVKPFPIESYPRTKELLAECLIYSIVRKMRTMLQRGTRPAPDPLRGETFGCMRSMRGPRCRSSELAKIVDSYLKLRTLGLRQASERKALDLVSDQSGRVVQLGGK